MRKNKPILWLLACAMCGCVTTGLVVSAKADVGTETETATITIGLNGGFRVDASGTSAAYSEEDVVYETLTGGLTLTHEKVREIFENQPAFQKAVGGIDYNVACPGGAEVGSYPETDANGYYNYTSVTNGIFSPVLFGLFEDKDEDGEVDEGERLYLSGDTIDVRGDVKLACYYNESLIYGYVNSTQTTLWKGWTAEGAEANACKYDPVTQPNGWRTEYTARDLQPLYFELSKIGAQAFSLDGGWGVAAVERIEFPETVKELDAFGMKQLGMLEEINLNNIEYIYDYGFQQCGNAVQGEKRYVFEKIRGISQQALYNTTNGNSTYRYIFAGTGLADTDVNKLLSYHNANGTQLTLIFGNFGNEQDKSAELKNPTSYVYVPYGKTELYYADETAYASGQTNFSVAKEGETIIRANMPVREMYTVSFDVNGGEIEGRNEIENTYMDARAVSVIRGGAEANLGDGTERTNNPAGQTLTLLKAERPEAPERAGFAFRGWQDQYGNMWTEADWEAGGKAGVDYGAEGAKLTAVWEHSDPSLGEHTYDENGVCTCGEKVELDMATLSLGSDTSLRFAVKKSVFEGYGYQRAAAEFLGKQYALEQTETNIGGEKYVVYSFDKINPALFGEDIIVTLGISGNGTDWLESEPFSYNVSDYCYAVLNNAEESAELKTVVADLLNYGAETQKYLNYKTDELINAAMTPEQAAMATQEEPSLTDSTKIEGAENLIVWEQATLELNASVSIKMMFSVTDGVSADNLTAKVVYGKDKVKSREINDFESTQINGETHYIVTIEGLNIVDLGNDVEICLTDGEVYSQTVTYGAESFAARTKEDESLGALVVAMMKYIRSAGEYFDPKAYQREDDLIYFGEYPQTLVEDEALIDVLGEQTAVWQSYSYYAGGEISDYMQYADVEYDGERYRGVKFTQYRMDTTTYSTTTWQDDNGYDTGTVYWFRYEPIRWRILSEENGTAVLVCDTVLDGREFNANVTDGNDYAESDIRAWLNNVFYETAFDAEGREIIEITDADGIGDKVCLMDETTANDGGFFADAAARRKSASDYAACQGVKTDDGYASWMLGTGESAANVYYVYCTGELYFQPVNYTNMGICPMITIVL